MSDFELSDDDLLSGFESCTLPPELWTHRAHVRVAYLYASGHSLPVATDKMRQSIKAYAKIRNVPEAIDSGYHETVTAAFMQLVFAANLQTGPHQSPQDFCDAHPELLDSKALKTYYSKEHLTTWEAKANFVAPDLCPLPLVIGDSLTIFQVTNRDNLALVRQLFTEYAESLDYQLCFQGFDKELSGLPGDYGLPNGRLYLAHDRHQPAGCVAVRPAGDGKCEMKRLWVRPQFRLTGLGRRLATAAIDGAREIGYATMRLHTAASMEAAIGLYGSLGFVVTKPSYEEPESGVLYMELDLQH